MSLIDRAMAHRRQPPAPPVVDMADTVIDTPVTSPDTTAANVADAEPAQPSVTHAAEAYPQMDSETAPRYAPKVDIDLFRLARLGMVTPDNPRSELAEQFRVIKRPLIRNAKGVGAAALKNGNLVMITSALPGEGKTFSSINLAVSMAMELDYTVLLVDADFSKPSVLNRLGLAEAPGFMDVLLGKATDLADVIVRTNIDNLSILPAGMLHSRATEMIASQVMVRHLQEIASRYHDRIILFDSPPLLATTEARALASHMGQIVLVVEAARTTHGAVTQALITIEHCPVKMTLLNKADHTQSAGLYGYGYGREDASVSA